MSSDRERDAGPADSPGGATAPAADGAGPRPDAGSRSDGEAASGHVGAVDPVAGDDAEVDDARERADNEARTTPGSSDAIGSDGSDGSPSFAPDDLSGMIAAVEAQRDEYLDLARRLQADFENYRRRVDGQRVEVMERANEDLVRELLPVLDAFDAARQHGTEVAPLATPLLTTLERRGLTVLAEAEVPFDPEVHEAVVSEPGSGEDPVVSEVLRAGYLWNGRVLRAAMVKVRG